jgi:crossover junction endodeoxyribonuclease RuvC
MFVLGIDPGLTRCGYGLIERAPRLSRALGARGSGDPLGSGLGRRAVIRNGSGGSSGGSGRHEMRAYGVLQTPHTDPINERLASLMGQLDALITLHRPDVVVVERVFFQTNARTAMGVAQASGLALALATKAGCIVAQYTSNEVKQAITGFGGAEKAQVQQMVARMLGLETLPKPVDAADALALALHHLGVAPFTDSVAASIGAAGGSGVLAAAIASTAGASASPFGNARVATSAGGIRLRSSAMKETSSSRSRSAVGVRSAEGSRPESNSAASDSTAKSATSGGGPESAGPSNDAWDEMSKAAPVRKKQK